MRVLLIGGSGQLGRALHAAFAASHELLSTAYQHRAPGHVPLDLADSDQLIALLEQWRPHLILLAGAMCHVDRCEREPDVCRNVNVTGPAAAAEYARRCDSRIVFFSTDHVFDGSRPVYREADEVHPLSVYARSKAEAETVMRDLAPEAHLIIRTGWVYGPDVERRNFIVRLIDRLKAGETVDVPIDQCGSPTYTEDLAAAVRHLVDRRENGTFHATGPELIDRASLARRVCDCFGLDPRQIVARPTQALGQAAQRSLRVLLDCTKLASAGASPFRDVAAGLDSLAGWLASADLYSQAR